MTLSISVPSVESEKVYGLVDAIRNYRQQAVKSKDKKSDSWIGKLRALVPAWFRSFAAAVVVCGAIVFLIVNPPMTKQPGESVQSAPAASASAEIPVAPDNTKIVTVNIGDTEILMVPVIPQWATALIILLGLGAYISYVRWIRPRLEESEYEQEAEDSHEFNTALNQCANALPVNPRDAIRLVNRMRFEYLMQDERYKKASEPVAATKLSELESLTYTLLNYHHPGYLNPDFVDHVVIPEIRDGHFTSPDELVSKLSGKYPDIAKVSKTFSLLKNVPQDIRQSAVPGKVSLEHFVDPDKLKAYVKLNRFVLVSEKLREETSITAKPISQTTNEEKEDQTGEKILPALDEKLKEFSAKQAGTTEKMEQD